MITKIKKLAHGTIDSLRAIIEGDYFSSSLQNQLVTLESLRSIMAKIEAVEAKVEAVETKTAHINEKTAQIETILPSLPFRGVSWNMEADQNAPEERILEFLMPRIKDKSAIDVGAHCGRFTTEMLRIGCRHVYCFEPHPELSAGLKAQYASDNRVAVFSMAVSEADGAAELHLVQMTSDSQLTVDPLLFSSLAPHNMPPGIEFHGKTPVVVCSLGSMMAEGLIPKKAGILKVDAEGFDLKVFKGMPEGVPFDVLMSEFWSSDFVFSTPGIPTQETVFRHLRENGYPYSISIIRLGNRDIFFVANMPIRTPKSWGNTLYFHDESLFTTAYDFVKNIMPQTI